MNINVVISVFGSQRCHSITLWNTPGSIPGSSHHDNPASSALSPHPNGTVRTKGGADLVPEPSVQEVEHGMLGATDVQVHWHPVLLRSLVHQRAAVAGIDEPQVVPAATRPLQREPI